MNRHLIKTAAIGLALATSLMAAKCDLDDDSSKYQQAHKAEQALKEVSWDNNAEIDNIKARLKLTSNPGQMGFILLLNGMGQPVLYTGVKGKITSGGKRLTPPDRASSMYGGGNNTVVRAAPSDEGTWGSSAEYIYFWTTDGQYMQWNLGYLYSDKPFRLKTEPLAIINASVPHEEKK